MLALALLLDAIFGEPDALWKRVPHPAVLMGNWIGWLDARLNSGGLRKAKGVAALILLLLPVYIVARLLSADIFFGVLEILGAAILLAQNSLMDHVRRVVVSLGSSLKSGRFAVSRIVGRDTSQLDESGVSRAAIESAAENFSDGVVAPAFWFLFLGLPGIALYKAVNTADSMIGYKNDKYAEFGWASARFDDLINWIPARISAILICFAGVLRRKDRRGEGMLDAFSNRFDTVLAEARLHRSPNAGWPEAATAMALNVALSGPRSYDERMTEDPFINADGRKTLGPGDVENCVALLWRSWGVLFVTAAILALPRLM